MGVYVDDQKQLLGMTTPLLLPPILAQEEVAALFK